MDKRNRYGLKRPIVGTVICISLLCNSIWAVPANALGGFNLKSGLVASPINEYRADIAPGVYEKRYSFEDREGKRREVFVVEVNLNNTSVSVAAGTPNNVDAFGTQTVRGQANSITSESSRVVAAVNGDYFNIATGEPFGIVYKGGRAVKPNQFSTWRFFGITKDKKALIGDVNLYNQVKDNLKEALGGQAILVNGGRAFEAPPFNPGKNPRTAVGIKPDGNVFFAVVDGRQNPYSAGITAAEFAQLMIDLGAVSAMDMDGGGSSTYLSRKPGEMSLELVNSPSDGSERKVANSWLVVSSEKSDKIFNNAYIEPYDKSFTPGTVVQFTAKGRDKSMAPAPLPNYGLYWSLSDSSFGTIDMNGRFVPSGRTGEVQVMLRQNGNTVGSTWIEIQNPDEFKLEPARITVIPGSVIPLDMAMKFSKRSLAWSMDDIIWQVPYGMGTVDKNGVLHVSKKPMPGKITARYNGTNITAELEVTVGQPPKLLFGFEEGLGKWAASTVGRGEKGAVGLSQQPGGQVRYGGKALKLDFDFTSGQKGTVLGVYAGPADKIELPGSPSSIGMWVYAPPEAKGSWLRMAVMDSKGVTHNVDLTDSTPGVNWTGWKYVKGSLPQGAAGPLHIHPTQAIRLMSPNAGTVGPMTKGSIYIDNIMAVYGTTDGLTPPEI